MTKLVLVLFIMLLFSVLARRYKLRVREEVINIYGIVSDIYTRYLSQDERSTCTYQSVHVSDLSIHEIDHD